MKPVISLAPTEPLSTKHQSVPADVQMEAIFIPTTGSVEELALAAYLSCLADPSPVGKLIAQLALCKAGHVQIPQDSKLVFSSQNNQVCGINLHDHMIRKGSLNAIEEWVRNIGGYLHCRIRSVVSQILSKGGLAIVIANETVDLGVVYLRYAK